MAKVLINLANMTEIQVRQLDATHNTSQPASQHSCSASQMLITACCWFS